MPEHFSDYWQAHAGAHRDRRERVAQVVDADSLKPCMGGNSRPWPMKVGPWSLLPPFHSALRAAARMSRKAVITNAGDGSQDHPRGFPHDDRFLTRLRVGQPQQPALEIHVLPFQVQDFTESRTSEQ
jgi:hypothetical protein